MATSKQQHIFFVDDEADVRKAVQGTLEGGGYAVTCFASAADCLEQLLANPKCNLVITDVKMPEMDGIELLTEVKRRTPWVPVLVVTGKADVPMATRAFKRGTTDLIEKPLSRDVLLSTIVSILKRCRLDDPFLGKPLTEAEARILHLILDGKSNKEIAWLLKRSVRTVEVHRSRVMKKFGVDNVVDLVKRATQMGLI